MNSDDLTEIEATAHLYAKNHTGPSFLSNGEAEIVARRLALQVPDLLKEIERLNSSPLDPGFDLALLEVGNEEGCADPNDVDQALRLIRAQTREIDRLQQADRDLSTTLDAAAERIGVLTLDVERLTRLAREGWEYARDAYEGEGCPPPDRIAEALKEIDS